MIHTHCLLYFSRFGTSPEDQRHIFQPPTRLVKHGTVSKDLDFLNDFVPIGNGEQFNDIGSLHRSNSTITYNPAYETDVDDSYNFPTYARNTPFPNGSIPKAQAHNVIGTLNSIPRDMTHNPIEASDPFSDLSAVDGIEFVTDILDDMTKTDNFFNELADNIE